MSHWRKMLLAKIYNRSPLLPLAVEAEGAPVPTCSWLAGGSCFLPPSPWALHWPSTKANPGGFAWSAKQGTWTTLSMSGVVEQKFPASKKDDAWAECHLQPLWPLATPIHHLRSAAQMKSHRKGKMESFNFCITTVLAEEISLSATRLNLKAMSNNYPWCGTWQKTH